MNSVSCVTDFNICFWNLNGVKNKFMSAITNEVFQASDILIINETHFNKRTKCPSNYILVESSPPKESKRPRGGVAIYKRVHCSLQFNTILNLPDCTVCEIIDTNILLIAMYIPPSTSPFYKDEYFENLKSIIQYFSQHKTIYVMGDLNSRYGDMNTRELLYKPNPDPTINTNGQKLRKLLAETPSLAILNGLIHENRTFDSNYTFSRGKTASQIDLCLTNNIDNTNNLRIMKKTAISDHNPVTITISVKRNCPLTILKSCATGFLSYSHYDINRKIPRTVKMENCNLVNLVKDLEKLGNDLLMEFRHDIDTKEEVEHLNQKITEGIREACLRNRRTETVSELINSGSENLQNCNSHNFQAIADANAEYFQALAQANDPRTQIYKDKWLQFQELALLKRKEELTENNSKQWKHLLNEKPKKMWELVDWKAKDTREKKELSPDIISKFFKGIFQAKKTEKDPKIQEAEELVNQYDNTCEVTDKDITAEEIDIAAKKMKRGVGIDGISPNIMSVAPKPLLEIIKKLYNAIYGNCYPECWNEQLLLSFAKKDHSSTKPSLRGIGIGPVLSRMFDVVVNMRFGSWYKPNKEQAGFREEQGCLIQILALLMLIDLSKRLNKDMFIGVIDYEKAFDFTNRYLLCKDMMNKQFGKRFIKNYVNSYETTSYVVKASAHERGDSIKTDQGLTQGKTTSASYFSLFVSDMPDGLDNKPDFMDPYYLLQLADDTTITAEIIQSFVENMSTIAKYSLEKYLRIHLTKSKYFHLTNNIDDKFTEDILLGNGITLKAITDDYMWLGFWLCDTNDISEIIKHHLSKKMIHTSSFYSWLAVNEDTPIKVKLIVLYGCLFATILYSCEVWVNLDELSEKLVMIEKKALKSCLGIKHSTPDDIVYLELNKADIVCAIRDRQYNFFQKFMNQSEDTAIAMSIWNLYSESVDSSSQGVIHYFQNLQTGNRKEDKEARKSRANLSERSMTVRYRELTNLEHCDVLYNSFIIEKYRTVITRWRLSSHSLRIETGRYQRPKIPRAERTCSVCHILEDEHHSIFVCAAHTFIRARYNELLSIYSSVSSILHPNNTEDANNIGRYILEIERNMEVLNMVIKF